MIPDKAMVLRVNTHNFMFANEVGDRSVHKYLAVCTLGIIMSCWMALFRYLTYFGYCWIMKRHQFFLAKAEGVLDWIAYICCERRASLVFSSESESRGKYGVKRWREWRCTIYCLDVRNNEQPSIKVTFAFVADLS